MTGHKSPEDITELNAMMHYVGRTEEIIKVLNDDWPLTPDEISDRTGISSAILTSGMLNELHKRGIVRRASRGVGGEKSTWAPNKPSRIEQLKDDMMGATL